MPSSSANRSNCTCFKERPFAIAPAQDSKTSLSLSCIKIDVMASSRKDDADVEVEGR